MENKPMLSVERELLETSEKACTFVGYEDAAGKLRALLDKPSCGACGGCDDGCKLDRESPTAAEGEA